MQLKISNSEIKNLLNIEDTKFPKYSTQIMNLASQNAQATRANVVGQMSELIQEFGGKKLEEWKDWYLKGHPDTIKNATDKIIAMVENFREVLDEIDEQLIERWVYDLVVVKTFVGLKFQEAILKKIAEKQNTSYRLAKPDEESKGIDGLIGDTPVSIKPITYKTESRLSEIIDAKIIYYEKKKDGIIIEF